MFLPHLTAVMIEVKLSSKRMISDAALAISVPTRFIARPTSDCFRAAASLVPSPVTATTFKLFKPCEQHVFMLVGGSGDDAKSILHLVEGFEVCYLPLELSIFRMFPFPSDFFLKLFPGHHHSISFYPLIVMW